MTTSDNASLNIGGFGDSSLQFIVGHFSSLFKKDCLQKPDIFNEENDVVKHITEVNNFCKKIGLEEEGAKCYILRETLPSKIRNQLLFEVDYKNKSSSYEWHKEKLIQLFPSHANNLVELVDNFSIKQ